VSSHTDTPMSDGDAVGDNLQRQMGLAGISWAWAHIDTQFEGGRCASWPPAPVLIRFVATTMLWRVGGRLVKFEGCDRHSRMRLMFAMPTSLEKPINNTFGTAQDQESPSPIIHLAPYFAPSPRSLLVHRLLYRQSGSNASHPGRPQPKKEMPMRVVVHGC